MAWVQRRAQLFLQFHHADMEPNADIVEKRNVVLVAVTLVYATLYAAGLNPPGFQYCKCHTSTWPFKNCVCEIMISLTELGISLTLMLSGIMLIILLGRNRFGSFVFILLLGSMIPYWMTLATFLHPLLWFAFMGVCWVPSCSAIFLFRRYVTAAAAAAAVPASPAAAAGGGEIVADGGEIV